MNEIPGNNLSNSKCKIQKFKITLNTQHTTHNTIGSASKRLYDIILCDDMKIAGLVFTEYSTVFFVDKRA